MKLIKQLGISCTMFLTMACSQGMETVLPDDPNNEPMYSEQPSTSPEEGGSKEGSGVDVVEQDPVVEAPITETPVVPAEPTYQEKILAQYDYVDPERVIPTEAIEKTLIYYHENKASFKNKNVVSLLDYSKKSTNKRWHLIDMNTGKVWSIHVSHGKGSDADHDGYAEKFSNTSGSNATSLGFYKTAETYTGSNGYSLRLDGLSSTNSNARARAVVVHGADYVQDTNVIQGRSWGCPAVSRANTYKVIDWIKGGSLIYAYK